MFFFMAYASWNDNLVIGPTYSDKNPVFKNAKRSLFLVQGEAPWSEYLPQGTIHCFFQENGKRFYRGLRRGLALDLAVNHQEDNCDDDRGDKARPFASFVPADGLPDDPGQELPWR
jgi:hypothetical protein